MKEELFPTIDKFVLSMISSFDQKERVKTLKLIQMKRDDPIVKLCLALMFESLNQRHDTNLRLARYRETIEILEKKIDKISELMEPEEKE